MRPKTRSSFLEEAVGLLVQYFGSDRVRVALAKVSNGDSEPTGQRRYSKPNKPQRHSKPSVATTLEQLRQNDEEKGRMLTDFYARLKEKHVLPESQDIRHFAQNIGLKDISGKSRKDMIPRLMRFLLEKTTQQLQVDIETAATVSEQQRQQGFSVLTDKLLGDK